MNKGTPEIPIKPAKSTKTTTKKSEASSNRQQKGSQDPIAEHNRYDILKDILQDQEQMELEIGDALDQGFPSEHQNKTFDPS